MADVQAAKKKYLEDFDHNALLKILPRPCVNAYHSSSSKKQWWKAFKEREIKTGFRRLLLFQEISETYTHTHFRVTSGTRLPPEGLTSMEQSSVGNYYPVEGDIIECSNGEYEIATAETVQKYTIFDIVIPLVGNDFTYDEIIFRMNEGAIAHKIIADILLEENLTLKTFNTVNK